MPDLKTIANFVLFHVAWFACVLGAANAQPWMAFIVVLILVFLQLIFAPKPVKAMSLIAMAVVIGAVVDQAFLHFEIVQYESHGWSNHWVPVWILGLWIAFASTLNVSFRWLRDNALLQMGFGGVGGPLAYYAAQKLGALTITPEMFNYLVMAVFWALATVILFALAIRMDGYDA